MPDESLTAYADEGTIWVLDHPSFTSSPTIEIGAEGRISGRAPCNRYFTQIATPLPWFDVGPIGATKMACQAPLMREETAYFALLHDAVAAEITGDTLLLTTEAGEIYTFRAAAQRQSKKE